jgi:hypothetical protein
MRLSRKMIPILLAQYNPFLSRKRVRTTLSGCRLFFITGMGRSGSVFLANLLNSPGSAVYHETLTDFQALVDAYWDPASANAYIDGTRSRVIASRILKAKCNSYGEVNSLLRFHVNALRRFQNATVMHLVRDGRMVVRSLMNRPVFTSADKNGTQQMSPKKDDPVLERWPTMDRFEKVCWYWASTVRYLQQLEVPFIRFEDILGSYDQFEGQVLRPLSLPFPYERWRNEIDRPKNPSVENAFPSWQEWTAGQKRQFMDLCGDVMNTLGYGI